MEAQSTLILRRWAIYCGILLATIIAFNILMDPYLLFGVPRWPHLNQRKPSVVENEALIKAYDLLRERPRTLILGTSSAARGLNARSTHWPADQRPVYNLAMAGKGPYASYRYVQHVLAMGHPIYQVLIAVDFEYFEGNRLRDPTARDGSEFEDRLAVTADSQVNARRKWQRLRDYLDAAISSDAVVESVRTLIGNSKATSDDIDAGNREIDDSGFKIMGDSAMLEVSDIFDMRTFSDAHLVNQAFVDLDALLALCQSHNIPVILVMNPVTTDVLELFDLLGDWPEYENWKRQIVSVAEKHSTRSKNYHISVWDFGGFESYSIDELGPNKRYLSWFWDGTHYNWIVGDKMLDEIFGRGSARFGAQVNSLNLESRLVSVRNSQALYRQSHPDDVRRIDGLIRLMGR